jgi:hypothetical protein
MPHKSNIIAVLKDDVVASLVVYTCKCGGNIRSVGVCKPCGGDSFGVEVEATLSSGIAIVFDSAVMDAIKLIASDVKSSRTKLPTKKVKFYLIVLKQYL